MNVEVQGTKVIPFSCDTAIRPYIAAQLIPVGTLSKARFPATTAVTGNNIFFVGGQTSAKPAQDGFLQAEASVPASKACSPP